MIRLDNELFFSKRITNSENVLRKQFINCVFGRYNTPHHTTTNFNTTIQRIINKSEQSSSVKDVKSPVRHRTSISVENNKTIATVCESVGENMYQRSLAYEHYKDSNVAKMGTIGSSDTPYISLLSTSTAMSIYKFFEKYCTMRHSFY